MVLLEDADGTLVPTPADGRSYRPAEFDDVILDAAAGRVTLKAERKGRVLAYYEKGGQPVGTDDAALGVDALPGETSGKRDLSAAKVRFYFDMPDYLGEDMNRRDVDIAGVGHCLLLWEPGDQSPFQAANTYAFEIAAPGSGTGLRAILETKPENPATGAMPDVDFSFDAVNRRVTPYVDQDFRANFGNWYPFHDLDSDAPINLLYGPDRNALDGLLDFEIVVQARVPVDGYVLGSEVVAGSVRVTVNGVEEHRFTVDDATGRVVFQVEIAPTDRIEMRWRTTDAGTSGGDVLLTWRDDIRLAENLGLWVAAGLRWNVGTGLTAGDPYARSGAVVAAAGLEGSVGALDWSVEAAVSFMNPDTTGVVRLHGMEGHSIEVDLSEELAWPAAPPADPTGYDGPSPPTSANRGRLLYRDYRSYDPVFGGAQLHPITWPDSVLAPYATGGRPGPYNVSGTLTDSTRGTSLVLEYDLPTDGDWAGTQLPVVTGILADLSTAKSVTVRMQGRDLIGSARMHLEIGAIGEDLDDDDELDAESSSTETGFVFDHGAAGLRVGAGPLIEGNRVLDSEDRDGSGTLTPEDPDRIALLPSAEPITGVLTEVTFDLEDADRAKLQQARSIRIIVESLAAGTSGKLVIDSDLRSPAVGTGWRRRRARRPSARSPRTPFLPIGSGPLTGRRLTCSTPQVRSRRCSRQSGAERVAPMSR